MIAVIDYNAGNISSLTNILDHIKINYKLTSDYRDLENSEKIILPGVSNFGFCMKNLIKLNFVDSLKEEVLKKKKKFSAFVQECRLCHYIVKKAMIKAWAL